MDVPEKRERNSDEPANQPETKKADVEDLLFDDPELPEIVSDEQWQLWLASLTESGMLTTPFGGMSVEEADARRKEQTLFGLYLPGDVRAILAREWLAVEIRDRGLNAFQAMKLAGLSAEIRNCLATFNEPWMIWFSQDFPELRMYWVDEEIDTSAKVGPLDEVPGWILHQLPENLDDRYKRVPWRRYYCWTCFFARRAYRECVRIEQLISQRAYDRWLLIEADRKRGIDTEGREEEFLPVMRHAGTYDEGMAVHLDDNTAPDDSDSSWDMFLDTIVPIDLRSPVYFRNPKWYWVPDAHAGETGPRARHHGHIATDAGVIVTIAGDRERIFYSRSNPKRTNEFIYEEGLASIRGAGRVPYPKGIESNFLVSNVQSLLEKISWYLADTNGETPRNPDWVTCNGQNFEDFFAAFVMPIGEIVGPSVEADWRLESASKWTVAPGATLNFDYPRAFAVYVLYATWMYRRAATWKLWLFGQEDIESEFQMHDEFRNLSLYPAIDRLRFEGEWPLLRALPAAPMVVERRTFGNPDTKPTLFIGKTATTTTTYRCSRCKQGAYSSKEEQRADWPRHRVACRFK